MLLLGNVARVERWDLLVPEAALGRLFDRLLGAAHGLAAGLGGTRAWQVGGRIAQPDLASLGMLATGVDRVPPLRLAAAALLHDLPATAGEAGLPLGGARQVRLLLGDLPG
ncbi:hypothetical protein, partial [Paracraurococcus ruber]